MEPRIGHVVKAFEEGDQRVAVGESYRVATRMARDPRQRRRLWLLLRAHRWMVAMRIEPKKRERGKAFAMMMREAP